MDMKKPAKAGFFVWIVATTFYRGYWIPACAGMTIKKRNPSYSSFRAQAGIQ
jgi:hypothetical protein